MPKTLEDIEFDFQRALTHAMTDAADDVLASKIEAYQADALILRLLSRTICLISATAGISWEEFEKAMHQTYELAEEDARQLREKRDKLIKEMKEELEKKGVNLDDITKEYKKATESSDKEEEVTEKDMDELRKLMN